MRYKRAVIDSLNLSSHDIQSLYGSNDYIIEPVKSLSIFEPRRWSETSGKSLTRNIIEASILHTHTGLTIPLKRYARSSHRQTIEFAGLHGYNERSKWLMALLRHRWSQLQDTRLMRVDVAIDFSKGVPKRVIKTLLKHRTPFVYGNTTYYKTEKEKKTNPYMDIKIYDKAQQAKLDFPLMRLEFVFKRSYFNELLLKDLHKAIKKMEKSIKKATGLSVKIKGI